MAKHTKKQSEELAGIIASFKRAEAYLNSDKVLGIARPEESPNGGSYTVVNPACAIKGVESVGIMNHHIGSDLALFYSGLKKLEKFYAEQWQPERKWAK